MANWVNFGTSGLLKRKDNSQIFNFNLTDNDENCHIKSIVQISKVVEYGIHGATFLDSYNSVSSDHVPLHQGCYSSPFVNDKIQINHYYFRSYEDYERKLARLTTSKTFRKRIEFEDEQKRYTKPSLELIKFYASIKNQSIKKYSTSYDIQSLKDFVEEITAMVQGQKIVDAELLCCEASLIFGEEAMVYYFRAVISRITNNMQRALHFIYEALKLSGSSTIYYEYSRILDAAGEKNKSRLAKKQGDFKKYMEDTYCE